MDVRKWVTLDSLDRELLDALQSYNNHSIPALSQHTRASPDVVLCRLGKLRDKGVLRRIRGPPERRIGQDELVAFILVRVWAGEQNRKSAGQTIAGLPGVVEVYEALGRIDYIVKVAGKDLDALQATNRLVQRAGMVAETELVLTFASFKEPILWKSLPGPGERSSKTSTG